MLNSALRDHAHPENLEAFLPYLKLVLKGLNKLPLLRKQVYRTRTHSLTHHPLTYSLSLTHSLTHSLDHTPEGVPRCECVSGRASEGASERGSE